MCAKKKKKKKKKKKALADMKMFLQIIYIQYISINRIWY